MRISSWLTDSHFNEHYTNDKVKTPNKINNLQ